MSQAYAFSSDNGITYTRKVYGLEALACTLTEAQVPAFYDGLCTMQIPQTTSLEQLHLAVRSAWIQLRHLHPALALQTSRDSDGSWVHHYTVPQSPAAVYEWADATILWHEDKMPLPGRFNELSKRFWRTSSGNYGLELHLGPDNEESKWHIAIHGPHIYADARLVMEIFAELATHLQNALRDGDIFDCTTVAWGEEVTRLAPSPAVLAGDFDTVLKLNDAPPAPPAGFVPFFPPVTKKRSAEGTSISHVVAVDADKAARFRTLCKSHGFTVTQVINSLLSLAHVESALFNAHLRRDSEEYSRAVFDLYSAANTYVIPWGIKDQRPSYEGYTSIHSPKGTPICSIDGFTICLSMDNIRATLNFSEEDPRCVRDTKALWERVVPEYVRFIKSTDLSTQGCLKRQQQEHWRSLNYDPAMLQLPGFWMSSIGDLDRAGFLKEFMPSSAADISISEVMHGCNSDIPIILTDYWQFGGRMVFNLHGGISYHTEEDMETLAGIFMEWIDTVLQC
ncbi:hypothetical protein WOLCODRAFT_155467 [Wolfiporia cocos MD-104 SS10]|uniref:Condensation domain-containing protein n=1 Tax=Wolfiporia cocos (strain MD-104) TaxID=742152 RepID=A0A2H3IXX6_WOLCO|nr:hypothetical protein WOLCODRAFT_155467 [Wolfiporia cocos MD-104 SS10]